MSQTRPVTGVTHSSSAGMCHLHSLQLLQSTYLSHLYSLCMTTHFIPATRLIYRRGKLPHLNQSTHVCVCVRACARACVHAYISTLFIIIIIFRYLYLLYIITILCYIYFKIIFLVVPVF